MASATRPAGARRAAVRAGRCRLPAGPDPVHGAGVEQRRGNLRSRRAAHRAGPGTPGLPLRPALHGDAGVVPGRSPAGGGRAELAGAAAADARAVRAVPLPDPPADPSAVHTLVRHLRRGPARARRRAGGARPDHGGRWPARGEARGAADAADHRGVGRRHRSPPTARGRGVRPARRAGRLVGLADPAVPGGGRARPGVGGAAGTARLVRPAAGGGGRRRGGADDSRQPAGRAR